MLVACMIYLLSSFIIKKVEKPLRNSNLNRTHIIIITHKSIVKCFAVKMMTVNQTAFKLCIHTTNKKRRLLKRQTYLKIRELFRR